MSVVINVNQFSVCCNPEVYLTRLLQRLPSHGYSVKQFCCDGIVFTDRKDTTKIVIGTDDYSIHIDSESDLAELNAQTTVALLIRGTTYAVADAVRKLYLEIDALGNNPKKKNFEDWFVPAYPECVKRDTKDVPNVRVGIHALNTSPGKFLQQIVLCDAVPFYYNKQQNEAIFTIKYGDHKGRRFPLYIDGRRGYVSYLMCDWFSAYTVMRLDLSSAIAQCCTHDLEIRND